LRACIYLLKWKLYWISNRRRGICKLPSYNFTTIFYRNNQTFHAPVPPGWLCFAADTNVSAHVICIPLCCMYLYNRN
jgi:hypothetical protein